MTDKIKKDDPRLTAFVLGELDSAECMEIESAISSSPELANAVDEIRMAVNLLGDVYQSEQPLALLDEQRTELASAVGANGVVGSVKVDPAGSSIDSSGGDVVSSRSAEGGSAQGGSAKSGRPWLPVALAASLLGLLVGSAFYFGNPPIDEGVASKMDQANAMSKSELEGIKEKVDKKNAEVESMTFDGATRTSQSSANVLDDLLDNVEMAGAKSDEASKRPPEFLSGGEVPIMVADKTESGGAGLGGRGGISGAEGGGTGLTEGQFGGGLGGPGGGFGNDGQVGGGGLGGDDFDAEREFDEADKPESNQPAQEFFDGATGGIEIDGRFD